MKKHRKLKVYSKSQQRSFGYVHIPAIRLEGKWLKEVGFKQGQKVKILIEENKLTITIAKNEK